MCVSVCACKRCADDVADDATFVTVDDATAVAADDITDDITVVVADDTTEDAADVVAGGTMDDASADVPVAPALSADDVTVVAIDDVTVVVGAEDEGFPDGLDTSNSCSSITVEIFISFISFLSLFA